MAHDSAALESSSDPIDVSIEAAVELDELKENLRQDVPALGVLFELLRTPGPAFEGRPGVSMLADIRAFALFRDSLRQLKPKIKVSDHRELQSVLEQFFSELESGVRARKRDKIDQAKQFCLAINANLVARQMSEIYARRERSDSRYVSHESSP
jgi:hypothetical protein